MSGELHLKISLVCAHGTLLRLEIHIVSYILFSTFISALDCEQRVLILSCSRFILRNKETDRIFA